jgi:hypothetical protein
MSKKGTPQENFPGRKHHVIQEKGNETTKTLHNK